MSLKFERKHAKMKSPPCVEIVLENWLSQPVKTFLRLQIIQNTKLLVQVFYLEHHSPNKKYQFYSCADRQISEQQRLESAEQYWRFVWIQTAVINLASGLRLDPKMVMVNINPWLVGRKELKSSYNTRQIMIIIPSHKCWPKISYNHLFFATVLQRWMLDRKTRSPKTLITNNFNHWADYMIGIQQLKFSITVFSRTVLTFLHFYFSHKD